MKNLYFYKFYMSIFILDYIKEFGFFVDGDYFEDKVVFVVGGLFCF